MGDEPRRSVRATKGINPKHRDDAEDGPKKPKGKGKNMKKQQEESAPSDEDEEEEAIIRCICGVQDDEGGRVMICCDRCTAWQHNDCMGLTEDENELPEEYYCELCKPENHKDLVAAMKRGEKPWEAAAKKREEATKKKKKGRSAGRKSKGGRQSKGGEALQDDHQVDEEDDTVVEPKTTVETSVEPVADSPAALESIKRKYEAEAEDSPAAQPTKLRKASSVAKDDASLSTSRRKSGNGKQGNRKSTGSTTDVSQRARKLHEIRQGARKNTALALSAKLEKQFESLSNDGVYQLTEGKTANSLAEDLSLAIEHSLFLTYCLDNENYSGAYRDQFLAITSNLQKNTELLFKLVDGTVSTDKLATMSSDELASKELQEQMAVMKEEADKQAMLIQDVAEGPRIRRTHKGEELVDDQSNSIANESTMAAPPPRRRESEMIDTPTGGGIDQDVPQTGDRSQGSGADASTVDTNRPMLASDRRTSSNFDIQNVWASVNSPDQDQTRPTFPPPARPASGHVRAPQQHDEEIDRLLDEDGNDSPPYSPTEHNADSAVTWRGTLDMPVAAGDSVAKFKAVAHHVAGTDMHGRATWDAIFPSNLVLHGRIEDKRADKYLSSLSAARSTDVSVHSIVPLGGLDSAAQAQFEKLFTYFKTRQRYGVVGDKLHRSLVRDIYVVPLEDGLAEMPTFLDRLDYNIIEQPRPQRMLLVVFVIRWDDEHSSTQATPSQLDGSLSNRSPSQQIGVAGQTPVPTAEVAMSPIVGQDFPHNGQQAQQHGFHPPSHGSPFSGQFPQNPYAPPHAQQGQNPNPAPTDTIGLAKQILGAYYDSPTAQTIIRSQPTVDAAMLRGLRFIFEANPATQHDMNAFTDHMTKHQSDPAAAKF